MQSTDAVRESTGDSQYRSPTVAEICDQIQTGGELALETNDFLSYATVLEIALGDPLRFSEDEATLVLASLYRTLTSSGELVYRIGWDLPELLLRYIDRFFVDDVSVLPGMKPFRLVMALFSLLSEHGNPQQLLLRSCELMLVTEGERHTERLAALSLDSQPTDVPAHDGRYEEGSLDIGAGDSRRSFEFGVGEAIQENVKFCTLFELMRFSLQRVETAYPSRFLVEAASTLLKVAEDPNADPLSLATYTRRMFLLARDFQMAREELVSEEEMQRVRSILVNFLTHAADVVLRRFSLKWAERLYLQMRNKVALAPPNERDFFYTETEYTQRMSEVMSRIAQLVMSYDFDPMVGFKAFVYDGQTEYGTHVENVDIDNENFWARELLKGPSPAGMGILSTQLHFDGSRTKKPDINMSTGGCSAIYRTIGYKSLGVKDQILYWALWISNYYDEKMAETANQGQLVKWLYVLLELISDSVSSSEKFVIGSVVARVLRFSTPEFAYNFCMDVMKNSDSHAQQFVAVESLKMLATGKIANGDLSEGKVCTATACSVMTPEQRLEIAQVSKTSMERLIKTNRSVPCYYYLNLLSVVPTDKETVLEICDMLENVEQGARANAMAPSCEAQMDMLSIALVQLREFANSGMKSPRPSPACPMNREDGPRADC